MVLLKYLFVITACSLCGIEFCTARNLSPTEAEFTEAIHLAMKYSSTIAGNGLTEEDVKQFDVGSKLEENNLEIEQLITKQGYKVEKYEVVTEDGYILTLFRIPSSGRAVFLMHGMLLSSDDWVTPGPKSGIAYLLADEGFDVWLANARGNKHSRRHLTLSPDSAEFWDFSWDEIGRYDLPAIIDLILNATRQSQLIYVGHSQGGACFYVMGSERPDYAQKVSLAIGLAPTGAVIRLRSPYLFLGKYFIHTKTLIALFKWIGIKELMSTNMVMNIFANIVCRHFEITRRICSNMVFMVSGYNYSHMNMTTLPVVLSHLPSGASFKQLEHYAQISGKFSKFDYGEEKNLILYGAKTPPEYDLGSITTPMAIFYSDQDWVVSEPDVYYQRSKLHSVVDLYKVPAKKFTHVDFMFGKDTKTLVVSNMLKIISKINP